LKSKIPLCFYPTKIIFVDDNSEFLSSLAMVYSEQFNVKLFDDPQAALTFINEQQPINRDPATGATPELYGDSEQWVKQVLNRPNLKRFDEKRALDISVLVVDYAMPSMNGIDFCKQINNPAIKKILLTGYATPNDAVGAFNDNTIHYYIKKSDENMLEQLGTAIKQLQQAYFQDLSSIIKTEAVDVNTPFFADEQLANYFKSVCDSLNVKEYYYLSNPSRFALQCMDGSQSLCLIYTEDNINEHLRILEEESAPSDLYKSIESHEYIPLFSSADGFYEPESFEANMRIYPAQKVVGQTNYYCAVISEQETYVDSKTVITGTGSLH
jgi:CheY-like chemotaxis protein